MLDRRNLDSRSFLMAKKDLTRRTFVQEGATALTASLVSNPVFGSTWSGQSGSSHEPVPRRPLGKTGAQVSALGVGGYHLGSMKEEKESLELVARALDAGINFFDNAWEYHDGVSEERLGAALKGK